MGILDFLTELPLVALNRLYSDRLAGQALFRALPALARLYVLRLASANGWVPSQLVKDWPVKTRDAMSQHAEALKQLSDLRLLTEEMRPAEAGAPPSLHLQLHAAFSAQIMESL